MGQTHETQRRKERENQSWGMLGLRNNQTVDNPCCRKL